jgi:hypothetical protein
MIVAVDLSEKETVVSFVAALHGAEQTGFPDTHSQKTVLISDGMDEVKSALMTLLGS